MLSLLKSSASGLFAQKFNLDVIANNIANVNTTAYKKSRVNFADAGYEDMAALMPVNDENPPDFKAGVGVTFGAPQSILSQGNLKETGNPWDLAIAGPGYFQVVLPDGTAAYTRDGSFQVDADGHLTTLQGLRIDPPLTIPEDAANVQVDGNGTVVGEVGGQSKQLGKIPLATFPSPEQLTPVGNNLYTASDGSGPAQIGQAGVGGLGSIVAGVQEASNVDLAEEMTKMLEAQRAYQLSAKAFQTVDEMIGLANNLRK